MKKILIDARMYGLENAGIGRYVMNLINNLISVDKENQYLLLLRKKYFSSLELPKNWEKILTDIPHYSFYEQIKISQIIKKEKPDLVHFPHFNMPIFYSGRYIVTIHDLIKHSSKGAGTTTRQPLFYWLKYLGYKLVFRKAVKGAIKILVPSKAIKEELSKAYNLPESKIVVTHEGVDDKFQKSKLENRNKNEILEKYKIQKPFILYVGSVYPHKNIEGLIQSIKLLNNTQQLGLVISCARNIFWERINKKIKELEAEKFVNLVGFIPDEELTVLYDQAETFVFPTLSEGFGLPGLEAMGVGCPVVCSDIPVLWEIYGEAAVYFNPLNISDMAKKIKEVVGDKNTREILIKKGNEQIKKYSWSKMAQQTLRVYQENI